MLLDRSCVPPPCLFFHLQPSADEPGGTKVNGNLCCTQEQQRQRTEVTIRASSLPNLRKTITLVGWNWQSLDSGTPCYSGFRTETQTGPCMCICRISCCISYEPVVQEGAPQHLMQIPNFFLSCYNSALDSVLCSPYLTAVFLSVTTVGQLMLLSGSLNSIVHVGKNIIPN